MKNMMHYTSFKIIIIILCCIVISSCYATPSDIKDDYKLAKPFVIVGKGVYINSDNSYYTFQDKNGKVFTFQDKDFKFNIGDTIY